MATDLYKASPNQYQLGSQLGARAGPLTPAPLGPLARAGQNTWGGTFTKTPQPAGTFDVTKVMNPQWARFFDMAAEATGGDFSNPETQQAPQQSPSITREQAHFQGYNRWHTRIRHVLELRLEAQRERQGGVIQLVASEAGVAGLQATRD